MHIAGEEHIHIHTVTNGGCTYLFGCGAALLHLTVRELFTVRVTRPAVVEQFLWAHGWITEKHIVIGSIVVGKTPPTLRLHAGDGLRHR